MACTAKQLNLISNGNMEYEAADDINNMMWRVCVRQEMGCSMRK